MKWKVLTYDTYYRMIDLVDRIAKQDSVELPILQFTFISFLE